MHFASIIMKHHCLLIYVFTAFCERTLCGTVVVFTWMDDIKLARAVHF